VLHQAIDDEVGESTQQPVDHGFDGGARLRGLAWDLRPGIEGAELSCASGESRSAAAYACIVGTSYLGLGRAPGCSRTAGAAFVSYTDKVTQWSDGMSARRKVVAASVCKLTAMGRRVDVDELVDARDVAGILGLTHRNTVSEYQTLYDDMPRPVIDLGRGRPKLWLRHEIERWAGGHRHTDGRGRRRRAASQSQRSAAR
jgi:hypothetical protein